MTLTIKKDANDAKDKEIVMGGSKEPEAPVADYYPPGVTEPIVRPAHIPAPTEAHTLTVDEEPEEEKAEDKPAGKKRAAKK